MHARRVSIDALREAAWVARWVGRAGVAPLRDEDVVALAGYLEQRQVGPGQRIAQARRATVWRVGACAAARWS